MASAYLATLAISAALRVREQTGRGQRVSTSLFQGVLATTLSAWQRVEHADTPNYQSWISDPRAPKGVFRCADGRWIHQWVPLPDFVISAAEGDRVQRTEKTTRPRDATTRIGMDVNEMLLLHHYQPLMAEAIAKFPSEPWVALGAEVGVPLQPLRSPEEALHDDAFLADGCVIEVDDPELGPVRQVGRVYDLHACPTDAPTRAPDRRRAHRRGARRSRRARRPRRPPRARRRRAPASPLAGVRVVDLGLAVAGPWGTMMLADLGAEVIKVNPLHDFYWMSTHIAMACNRGKRSIALNLKDPAAMEILHELVAGADIVQHNMRYDAAVRLGVDYESLRAIKPDLIYCHTRGFEHGAREGLPGNDQTGAALAGPDWLDGGLDHDGIPLWPVVSLGDTGNGFLSAIGMVQALYHRDRTGEGQFVDTSIMYAQLLNASIAWSLADGSRHGDRPSLDAMQLGYHATQRLYETADGWLCVAATTDEQRSALATVARRRQGHRRHRVRRARARVPHPQRGAVVREPRRRGRALRGLEPRLRARPVRRSRDDREGLGHEVPPSRSSATWSSSACSSTSPRRPASCRDRRSCRARTPAPSCSELGYDDARIDALAEAKTILDWRP